jgi:hypothetical protein
MQWRIPARSLAIMLVLATGLLTMGVLPAAADTAGATLKTDDGQYFIGKGFGPGEPVSFWDTYPDGSVVALSTLNADDGGAGGQLGADSVVRLRPPLQYRRPVIRASGDDRGGEHSARLHDCPVNVSLFVYGHYAGAITPPSASASPRW